MVATKVLISLCALGLARAAPQLGVPVGFTSPLATTSSVRGQQAIVTDVVSALQPSIATAVADALRSLSFGASRATTSSSSFGSSSGSSFGSSSSGFNSGATSATGVAVSGQDEVTARPNYNYEFKVADDDEQTYISHNEARDGDDVTGTYSYVDPNGALITVNYQAGAMGYTQTLDKKDNAVQIRSKAGSSRTATSSSSSNSASSSRNSGSSSSFGSSFGSSNTGSSLTRTTTTSANAGFDSAALINQIVLALQPQINQAVSSAVADQSTSFRTVTSSTGFAAPTGVTTVVAGDRLTPLFGN